VRTLASKGLGEVANQLSVYNHGVDNHEDKGANTIKFGNVRGLRKGVGIAQGQC